MNAIRRSLIALMLSALLGASLPAIAVSPEPAAQQQQAHEQERELRQQQEVVPDVQGEAAQQIQWALAAAHRAGRQPDSPLGRCLGANGINLILKRVHHAIV